LLSFADVARFPSWEAAFARVDDENAASPDLDGVSLDEATGEPCGLFVSAGFFARIDT
jgi:hypothetical protein